MSEPKRWLEQGAPRDVELLLRAARDERPDAVSLRRTLSAVGTGLGAASVASGSHAAGAFGATKVAAPLAAGAFAKWTALVLSVGALTAGAAQLASPDPHPPRAPIPSTREPSRRASSAASAARSSAKLVRAPSPTTSAPRALPAHSSAPYPPRDAEKVGSGSAPPSSVANVAPSAALGADTLTEEVKSIDRARAALSAGRSADALVALDDYERRFRERDFAPEALYLRMEAYDSLGRTAEARGVAERLLATHPNTLHGARARALLSKPRGAADFADMDGGLR